MRRAGAPTGDADERPRSDHGEADGACPARAAAPLVKDGGAVVVEAAARCGISQSAVKINVHRGLKALSAVISA